MYQTTDLEHLSTYERERWLHAGPAIAATLATPGASASHSTAAVLRRVPLAFLPELPCVTVVPVHTGHIPRTHVHRGTADMFVPSIGAVSCTGIDRTLVDLAREHGVMAGVVAMDFALREELITRDQIEAAILHGFRWPGIVEARAALVAADSRSESPLESRSRLKLAEFGLPKPDLQVSIGDQRSRFLGRVDFFWPDAGVVGEVDGSMKYDGDRPDALVQEKWRQEQLERTELIVVRWGNRDLASFARTAERLRRALARGARRPAAERRWIVLQPRHAHFDPVVGVS